MVMVMDALVALGVIVVVFAVVVEVLFSETIVLLLRREG
jgi:hypothetical protein